MSVLVLAFASAGGASAQSVTINVRVDNDKLQAFEARFKPGDENKDVPRGARVTRALTSGTLLRTYPDGKTEKIELKPETRDAIRRPQATPLNIRPRTLEHRI